MRWAQEKKQKTAKRKLKDVINSPEMYTDLKDHIIGTNSFPSEFTRENLKTLCKAMDIKFAKNDKKDTLQKKLLTIIKDNDHFLKPQFLQITIPVGNVGTDEISNIDDECNECKGTCQDDQWILCDSCESWHHRQCVHLIDDDEWEAFAV